MATVNRINIPNETLEQFAERYRIISSPQFVNVVMRKVTIELDRELLSRMANLSTHPKDTGLMKKSWVMPEMYLKTHYGKQWQVYLLNTATVGEQARLKDAQTVGTNRITKRRKRTGRHNLKRYMPWVDKRTKFYTKQLKVLRNKIKPIFKEQLVDCLARVRDLRPDLLSPEETIMLRQDIIST